MEPVSAREQRRPIPVDGIDGREGRTRTIVDDLGGPHRAAGNIIIKAHAPCAPHHLSVIEAMAAKFAKNAVPYGPFGKRADHAAAMTKRRERDRDIRFGAPT